MVFHTAGINEKKNREKKIIIILCRTWKGYCLFELGGWARRTGRRARAGRRWARSWCAGRGAGLRRSGRWGAGLGAGRQGACVLGARGRRALAGVQARGRAGCAGERARGARRRA